MLKYKDFVPVEIESPGFLNPGEHESFDHAVVAANQWIIDNNIKVIGMETVVLPNIWSRWEEGSNDASIGTSGDAPADGTSFFDVGIGISLAVEMSIDRPQVASLL